MILSLINQQSQLKSQRKKFIPFVNERNHMGNIIRTKTKQKSGFKTIEVFENLKKSTQEYFFNKKYQKMKNKLQRYKLSLLHKEPDYDIEVQKCFRSLQKFYVAKQNNDKKQDYFITLNQKLNDNIKSLRDQIQLNKNKGSKKVNQKEIKLKHTNTSYCSLIVKNQKNSHMSHYKQSRLSNLLQNNSLKNQIKESIFNKNSIMKDFISCSQKFKGCIKKQNYDPWKKWYKQSQIQIFPGKIVKIKTLQKSIYG